MNPIIKTTTVILDPIEANDLILFRQHRELFMELLATGAFQVPSGKVELNFNDGKLMSVYRYEQTYRRTVDNRRNVIP